MLNFFLSPSSTCLKKGCVRGAIFSVYNPGYSFIIVQAAGLCFYCLQIERYSFSSSRNIFFYSSSTSNPSFETDLMQIDYAAFVHHPAEHKRKFSVIFGRIAVLP